jgi:F0F1-type ATP synthase assembly protein I
VKDHPWRDYGRYGTVGIELIVSMALGYYGGRYLDARISGHGWVTVVGSLLGIAVGFRAIFVAGHRMQRDVERAERADGEEPWHDDRVLRGKQNDDRKPGP